ncbi:MAG: hypothetical protein HRU38_25020 [Saccharospirillaceae bacterium]|nr:hypothetical protein [Pseudomonadales bacterium]NRB81879.1 hypothetical protein [Saccharospirillaceae bacterium]
MQEGMDNYTPPTAEVIRVENQDNNHVKINKLPAVMFLHWIEDSFQLWFSLKWRMLLGCFVLLMLYTLVSGLTYIMGNLYQPDTKFLYVIGGILQVINSVFQFIIFFISAAFVLYLKDVDSNIETSFYVYLKKVLRRYKSILLYMLIYAITVIVGIAFIYFIVKIGVLSMNKTAIFILMLSVFIYTWIFIFSPVLLIDFTDLKVKDAMLISFKAIGLNIIPLVLFAIVQLIILIIIAFVCTLVSAVNPFAKMLSIVLIPFIVSYCYASYCVLYIQIFSKIKNVNESNITAENVQLDDVVEG